MAIINPNPQDVGIPNWENATQPIKQIEGDKSLGVALSGVGTVLKDAGELYKDYTKTVDFKVDTAIQDEVKSRTDVVRDDQIRYNIAREEALRNATTAINPAVAQGSPLDLLQINNAAEKMPGPIQDVETTAMNLAHWRADKKFPETLYRARIANIQKDLREEYPNYRDYVDAAFAKAGFGIPANELLRAQQADINALMSSIGDNSKKVEAEIWANNKIPGMPDVYAKWKQGKIDDVGVMKFINGWNSSHAINERIRDDLSTKDAIETDITKETSRSIQTTMSINAAHTLDSPGWKDLVQQADDVRTGKRQPDSVDWVGNNMKMDAMINQLRNEAISDYNKLKPKIVDGKQVYDKNGKPVFESAATRLGPNGAKTINDIVEENIKPLIAVKEMINNQQTGPANALVNIEKQRQSTLVSDILKTKMGDYLRKMEILRPYPEYIQKWFATQTTDPDFLKASDEFKAVQSHAAIVLSTPTLPGDDPKKETPKDIIDKVVESRGKSPATIRSIINNAKEIGDPSTPPEKRKALLDHFYDPSNKGITANMNMDTTTVQRGGGKVFNPGKYTAFYTMFSPDNIKAAHAAGKDTFDNMVALATNEFNTSLFGADLKTLEGLKADPRFQFVWNNESHKIDFRYHPDYLVSARQQARFGDPDTIKAYLESDPDYLRLTDMTTRINKGISVMSNIAKENGTDVNAYLASVLKNAGYSPGEKRQASLPDLGVPQGHETMADMFAKIYLTMPHGTGEPNPVKPIQLTPKATKVSKAIDLQKDNLNWTEEQIKFLQSKGLVAGKDQSRLPAP